MGQKTISGHNFDALRANRDNPTAALVLEDGTIFTGFGSVPPPPMLGSLLQYLNDWLSEIMTDPSYAGQIITFTFPHIGNVGANTKTLRP